MTDLLESQPHPRRQPRAACRSPWRNRGSPVVCSLVCLLLLAMWVYAFGFASKKACTSSPTRRGATREQICAKRRAATAGAGDTSQGYISNPTHAQMIQRADIVDKATDILDG